ncbi:MAG: ATP-binding cassette domain-containing protein, partial [Janthinobacterium lividum]
MVELLLQATGIVKRFGGFKALDGVDLSVAPGEIVGLIGPNGSGKTTFINVVSGLLPADGGTVSLAGETVTTLPA